MTGQQDGEEPRYESDVTFGLTFVFTPTAEHPTPDHFTRALAEVTRQVLVWVLHRDFEAKVVVRSSTFPWKISD